MVKSTPCSLNVGRSGSWTRATIVAERDRLETPVLHEGQRGNRGAEDHLRGAGHGRDRRRCRCRWKGTWIIFVPVTRWNSSAARCGLLPMP